MGKIWEFFENMDEYIYVSDVDNYEIIYLNKKAREVYGIRSLSELKGKKCYEVIHNCSMPCSLCCNNELRPGHFKEWNYFNPKLGKNLVVKETIVEDEGRFCHLEIGLDANAWQGTTLYNYQNLEAIVNEGLRVALQAGTPDRAVAVSLEYLGKALNAERTYIFEKNKDGYDVNTYEWVANGVTPEKDNLQKVPPEVCESWYSGFHEGKNIVIADVEMIREENPLQYSILKRQNIYSLVVVPLYDERKIIGFYGVDNPLGKSLDYTSNMLQIMGHFMVSSIKQRNLLFELQDISFRDYLTQLGNRHAMQEYIQNIKQGENIGSVYCDVTGLKVVNDTKGHQAGDDLLVRASRSLKRFFDSYGLFRIGGDEFLALCIGIDEDTLLEKVELLKKDTLKNSVVMAVGAVWEENSRIDIDWLLVEAEKRMYEDKAMYYRTSGVDRRR